MWRRDSMNLHSPLNVKPPSRSIRTRLPTPVDLKGRIDVHGGCGSDAAYRRRISNVDIVSVCSNSRSAASPGPNVKSSVL